MPARLVSREIGSAGRFNQALIFYHFGSVHNLLRAALDLVSARRMRAYEPAFEQAQTVSELATLAREIYAIPNRLDSPPEWVRAVGVRRQFSPFE